MLSLTFSSSLRDPSPIPPTDVRRLRRQRIRIHTVMRLSIHPNRILRAASPRKRPPRHHHLTQLVDLVLNPPRLNELPLRICRLEDTAIRYLDSHEPVRHVD